MKYHELDPLVAYEQAIYKLMKEAILIVYAEFDKCIEEFGNAIRARNKRNFEDMDCLKNEICKTRICIREFLERRQNNTLLIVKLSELKEEQEQDKKENTPNKSSSKIVVQETVGYIRTKVKEGEKSDHLS